MEQDDDIVARTLGNPSALFDDTVSADSSEVHRPETPDIPTFRRYLKDQKWIAAWEAFKNICSDETLLPQLTESHFTLLLRLSARQKPPNVNAAIDIILTITQLGRTPTTEQYNLLIECHARQGQVAEARATLAQMAKAGITPDMETYNLFLKLYVRQKDFPAAMAFFQRMIQEGVAPDVESYNIIIAGCFDANDRTTAERLFSEMTDLGYQPTITTFNHMIRMHIKNGDLEAAEKSFDQIERYQLQPDGFCCTTLMAGFTKNGQPEKALELFDRMMKLGLKPDVITYSTVIKAKAQSRDLDGALKSLEDMNNRPDIQPDPVTYHILIDACCTANRFTEAEGLAIDWQRRSPTGKMFDTHLHILVSSLADAGKATDAHQLFEQHIANGNDFPTRVYNSVMKAAALELDMPLVRRLWARLNGRRKGVDVEAFGGGGKVDRKGFRKLEPDAMSYAIVLEAMLSAREVESAMKVCREMLDAGYEPDLLVWITLIEGCCEARKFPWAAQCLEWMRSRTVASKEQEVGEWIKEYAEDFEDLVGTITKGGGWVENPGRRETVRSIYSELVRSGVVPGEKVFWSVMESYRVAGDLIGVVKVWTHLTTEGTSKPSRRCVTSLMRSISDLGQEKTARVILGMVKTDRAKYPMDREGWIAYLEILARWGSAPTKGKDCGDEAGEICEALVDMSQSGEVVDFGVWRRVRGKVIEGRRGAVKVSIEKFFEENWPEALEEVDGEVEEGREGGKAGGLGSGEQVWEVNKGGFTLEPGLWKPRKGKGVVEKVEGAEGKEAVEGAERG
ncbi:hypothetical protein HDV00_009516 [Rhizophlyctis rosea]|nr:hypothetical protein HDV00_009516 [Rhizophlyctis rosea]